MKRFQRAFAFLLLVALVFAGAAAAEENGKLQVHFLRIGRNDGILISMNGETAFIDGGSRYHGNVAADYMEKLGVTHLNYYIGTHAHSDHVGAACSLLTRTRYCIPTRWRWTACSTASARRRKSA